MSASGGYLVERHVGFVTIYLEYQSSLVPVAAVRADMKSKLHTYLIPNVMDHTNVLFIYILLLTTQ